MKKRLKFLAVCGSMAVILMALGVLDIADGIKHFTNN